MMNTLHYIVTTAIVLMAMPMHAVKAWPVKNDRHVRTLWMDARMIDLLIASLKVGPAMPPSGKRYMIMEECTRSDVMAVIRNSGRVK